MTHGFLPTFASPVMDGERLYTVDNSAIIGAFDLKTGNELWKKSLGTLQKGSPVLADGKLYVGTENGKFYILRPSATGVEVLDEDLIGTATNPEPIIASPAIADGRIYVVTHESVEEMKGSNGHVYAIGARSDGRVAPREAASRRRGVDRSQWRRCRCFRTKRCSTPGGKQAFTLRLFDAKGNFIREEPAANAKWTVDQLQGTADATAPTPRPRRAAAPAT